MTEDYRRAPEIIGARRGNTRRGVVGIIALALMRPTLAIAAPSPTIHVHKDPNCGCCSGWVRHLQAAGFGVKIREENNLQDVRNRLGVPDDLAACHTAEADGYVIEGHVPASAIQRLLKERPMATGVAVPGMPSGSPGMEGGPPDRYAVVLFGSNGRRNYMEFVGLRSVG